jgi:hypothetical protein
MSIQYSAYRSAVPEDGAEMQKETIYRVVLEGVKSEETLDSFAIKYGILTSTPVTRIKFMLRNLPKTIIETKNAARARGTLELIEEAGGAGTLEEFDPEVKPTVEIADEEPTIATVPEKNCMKCGFPLKNGDEYCQFCHTPLSDSKPQSIKTVLKAGGGGHLVQPKRLYIYLGIVIVILILGILTR